MVYRKKDFRDRNRTQRKLRRLKQEHDRKRLNAEVHRVQRKEEAWSTTLE